jgi:hypothetical protein
MSLANGSANKAKANARYMDKLMQGKVNVRATKKHSQRAGDYRALWSRLLHRVQVPQT